MFISSVSSSLSRAPHFQSISRWRFRLILSHQNKSKFDIFFLLAFIICPSSIWHSNRFDFLIEMHRKCKQNDIFKLFPSDGPGKIKLGGFRTAQYTINTIYNIAMHVYVSSICSRCFRAVCIHIGGKFDGNAWWKFTFCVLLNSTCEIYRLSQWQYFSGINQTGNCLLEIVIFSFQVNSLH